MAKKKVTTKKKTKQIKAGFKFSKRTVVGIVVACAIVGGLAVFRSFAASAPYSRLDCFTTQNKGYSSAYGCYGHSIEGQTAQAFIGLLGRKPEKTALQYWSNVYATYRTAPQQTLINKLLQGSEAQTKFVKLSTAAKVKYLYNSVLQRQPDPSGSKYWTNRINNEANLGQTIAAFLNTSQSFAKTQPAVQQSLDSLGLTWRPSRQGKAVSPRGVYANWNWNPPAQGYTSLSHDLTISSYQANSSYFWSHQYKYINGDGGYIGLQTTDKSSSPKQAIFSIFSSGIAAKQNYCKIQKSGFDGYNTSGTSCIIPYNWVKGRKYHLITALTSTDSTGSWWTGSVTDTVTKAKTTIGTIKVPKSWKGTGNWSVMWTENYYSTAISCSDIPYSKATFSTPSANGSIKPTSASQSLSAKYECNNSKSTKSGSDVVQEVGL